MKKYLRKNFGFGTLASSITAESTQITLNAGHNFPITLNYFILLIWDSAIYPDPNNDPDKEFVEAVYSGTLNVYTIVRAQESTTAVEHSSGAKCGMFYSAGISDSDFYYIGSKEVDETTIGNGKLIAYNSSSGKLEFTSPLKGDTGVTGAKGDTGIQGKGDTGLQGTAGVKGDTGVGAIWIEDYLEELVNSSEESLLGLKTDLDFQKQQALNFVIEVRTSDPESPIDGQMWFRSDLA